jgi:hypothetical protein
MIAQLSKKTLQPTPNDQHDMCHISRIKACLEHTCSQTATQTQRS